MPISRDRTVIRIETELRQGNYENAKNISQKIASDLQHIKIESEGPAQSTNYPWWYKAISGVKDQITTNTVRNDQAIIVRLQSKLLAALSLFYLNQTQEGSKAFNACEREINLIRGSLYPNYQEALSAYIEQIHNEIQEVHLLSLQKDEIANQDSTEIMESQDEIDTSAFEGMSEDELYREIGKYITQESKISSIVLAGKLKLLASNDKILLPKSTAINTNEQLDDLKFGKKLVNAMKRSVYNILCDPENRIGEKELTSKNIKKVVAASLISVGITSYPIVAPFVAFVLMFGIETFCEMSKPKEIS